MKRDSFQILGFTLLFAVAYGVLLNVTGWHADFSETDFHANLGRVHVYLHGPHKPIEILGSSMSARLLPQYFSEGGLDVGNLGLDGGKVVTALRILLRLPDLPAIVLLEENTLLSEPSENDKEVLDEIDSFSFWLATKVPLLQPQARPSSILYSALKRWRERPTSGLDGRRVTLVPAADEATTNVTATACQSAAPAVTPEIERLIRDLQQRGVTVAIFHLPHNTSPTRSNEPTRIFVNELIQRLDLPSLDLGVQMLRQKIPIQYTDGTHLTTPSARAASAILSLWLQRHLTMPPT